MRDHPIHQFFVMPVTINHRDTSDADEYGDLTLTVDSSTDHLGYLAQNNRGETDQIEHERWSLYLRPDAVIDANDEVIAAGMTLEVRGNPWVVIDPVTAEPTHIEATVQRRQ